MKRSLSTSLIFVFLTLAVVFYFGVQGYRYLVNPQAITPTYAFTTEEKIETRGLFVREETVIECEETMLELERAEGERVGTGGVLATVYHSESALARQQELDLLEGQLEQLQYAQSVAKDAETALKLDGDTRDGLVELRAALCAHNYSAAAVLGAELKTTVLKREYAYRGSSDLGARVSELQSRIKEVRGDLSKGSETIRAPFSGTYSALVDGYEAVVSPEMLASMSVAEYKDIRAGYASSTVGKLIAGDEWYYACVLSEKEAETLSVGQAVLLRAGAGVDFDLPVTVSRLSKPEGGEVLVVLKGEKYLSYVTLLRAQNAELITESHTGLRIPKNALRVGEGGQNGVYCRVGLRAYFKPVEVLYGGEDYFLVSPIRVDSTSESTIQLYTLRAGDEVIVSAEELYDGKVIE